MNHKGSINGTRSYTQSNLRSWILQAVRAIEKRELSFDSLSLRMQGYVTRHLSANSERRN